MKTKVILIISIILNLLFLVFAIFQKRQADLYAEEVNRLNEETQILRDISEHSRHEAEMQRALAQEAAMWAEKARADAEEQYRQALLNKKASN